MTDMTLPHCYQFLVTVLSSFVQMFFNGAVRGSKWSGCETYAQTSKMFNIVSQAEFFSENMRALV